MFFMNILVVQYAFRNLLRYKRRSLLTIGTVALSAIVTIVGFQYADSVLAVWKQGAIDHGAGHVQIHSREFYLKPDVLSEATLLEDGNPVEKVLNDNPQVFGLAKRVLFEGIISLGRKSMYFQGRGIDVQGESIVSPGIFQQDVISGIFVEKGNLRGITIGKGLAESLDAKVGDEVTLMTNTLGGSVNGIDVTVTGILDFPVPMVSKRMLYMNIEFAQKALGFREKYSEIAIRLSDKVDPELWLSEFIKENHFYSRWPSFDIRGWWKIEPLIRRVQDIWHSIMGVIIVLLFSTAAASVLNIVYLLVAERMVEIGTLMSLGAKPPMIIALFAMEGAAIGVIGSLFGALIANFILLFLYSRGIPFDSPFASGVLTIYPQPSLFFSLFVFFFGVAICFFSAIFPAHRASKIPPIAAFRGQMT